MRKIPTLFERDWDGDRRYVLPQVTPGCEWVIAGEGTPTRKYDGTCVMFDGERWWARREVKADKMPPKWYLTSPTVRRPCCSRSSSPTTRASGWPTSRSSRRSRRGWPRRGSGPRTKS
jgi:hypothetical protein